MGSGSGFSPSEGCSLHTPTTCWAPHPATIHRSLPPGLATSQKPSVSAKLLLRWPLGSDTPPEINMSNTYRGWKHFQPHKCHSHSQCRSWVPPHVPPDPLFLHLAKPCVGHHWASQGLEGPKYTPVLKGLDWGQVRPQEPPHWGTKFTLPMGTPSLGRDAYSLP